MQQAGLSEPPRPDRRGFLVALGVLTLLGFFLLREALVGGQVLTQADALYQFSPWSDVAPEGYEPENPLLLDQAIVMQPWLHFGGERVQNGVMPWWNPDNYLGQPMVGTYQTAYFWPLNWAYLLAPSWSFYAWSALLRLVGAGLFTYLFLRELGTRSGAALVGAVGYAFCGFMIAWLGHMHTHVAPFLPAMLWQVERLARRPSARAAGWLALFAGFALLAGHVQTAVHLGLAVAAYAVFRACVGLPARDAFHHRPHPPGKITAAPEGCTSPAEISPAELSPAEPSPAEPSPGRLDGRPSQAPPTRLGPRGLLLTVAAGALGLLLAAPQLLPFLDYLSTSQGAVVLEHFETVSEVDPLAPASLMLAPGRFGSPAPEHGFGAYTGPSGWNVNYSELIGGFVGRTLLVLALLYVIWLRRLRPTPATWFFAGLAVVAAGVAWQVWPFYDLANSVPKLKSTKLMRASVLLAFALSVLGAFGVDALARRLRLEGLRAAALFGAAALLVGGELVTFARGYNPMIAPEHVTPPTPVTDYLREQPGLWRALGTENSMLIPSANLFYRIPMVGGYDSMEARETTELVALMSSDEDGRYFIKEIDYFDQGPAIGDLLGVRYLLARVELPPPYELVLDGPTKVYANPNALPRAFAARELVVEPEREARLARLGSAGFDPRVAVLEELPETVGLTAGAPLGAGTVEIASYGDLQVELTCDLDAPGLVVISDAWDRSWKAYVDGEPAPLLRVDHALRGVAVEAGAHEIEMRYEPWALRLGLALGGAALVVIAAGLVLGRR